MKKNNKNLKLFLNLITKGIYFFKNLSFLKHILFFYTIITFVGAGLLSLSFSQRDNINVGFGDALFTAASAFSDTGLTTLSTAETWSEFGQAIIAILIMLGGIGWFSLKVYFINIILGKPISFSSTNILAAERGSSRVGLSKNIIKVSLTTMFVIMLISSIVLTLFFFFSTPTDNPFNLTGSEFYSTKMLNQFMGQKMLFENPHNNFLTSLRFGVFHSISAINNAGFDIIGSNSIAPYYHHYGLQFIFLFLFIIGGIGYPVIYDIWNWIKAKIKKEKYHWSLFTKISTIVYFTASILGVIFTFVNELSASNYTTDDGLTTVYSFWNNPMYGNYTDKGIALFFNSMSTRNAGFSTIRLGDLAPGSIILFIVLMFIGSAPSSTAGGIRTTTLGVIITGLISKMRGKKEVRMFNRRIPNETVIRSYIVFTFSIILLFITSIITYTSFANYGGEINGSADKMFQILGTDNKFHSTSYNFSEVFFEVTSAFGTTGLSVGITRYLNIFAKIAIIIVMFIGQLGVSSFLMIWSSKKIKSKNYTFVEEDITIG